LRFNFFFYSPFYLTIVLFSSIFANNNFVLAIDPYDIHNFFLNKYNPNENVDLKYYSIMLDGSTNFPLYQSIPNKIGFNRSSKGTISELKYKERKADKYFDASISLKKDFNDSSNTLFQFENKSIINSINHNLFFDYMKKSKNLKIGISYLYHYEDDPDFYSLVDTDNSLKENESFNSGVDINYYKDKILFKSHHSFQVSYIDRPSAPNERFEYNHQTIWSNNYFSYSLIRSFKFYLNNKFKRILIESMDSQLLLDENYNYISCGFSYETENDFQISLGFDNYNNIYKQNMLIDYNKRNISLSMAVQNYLLDSMNLNNEIFNDYRLEFTSQYSTSFSFIFKKIISDFEFGLIENDSYKYNYVINGGEVNIWNIALEYDYYKYFDVKKGDLSLNSYLHSGLTYFPFKGRYKYELYGKIDYYQYELNSSVNLLSLNLFDNFNITQNNVKIYNISIGFIFDSFRISYKFKNGITSELLNNEVQFSQNMNNFSHINYIELDWIFKE